MGFVLPVNVLLRHLHRRLLLAVQSDAGSGRRRRISDGFPVSCFRFFHMRFPVLYRSL